MSTGALEAIVAHARAMAPRECCGVLLGHENAILEAVPTANLADNVNRFLIDPHDHIEARRLARNRGLAVVGFYHSHPRSDAIPSPVDLAEAGYADHLYLIVGLKDADPDVRIYQLEAGTFLSRRLKYVPEDVGNGV
jgi:proteasome lid subunit RPN8/RPN11